MLCAGGSISMSPRLSHGQRFDRTPPLPAAPGGFTPGPDFEKEKEKSDRKDFFLPRFLEQRL
jgi:hypothetical protein